MLFGACTRVYVCVHVLFVYVHHLLSVVFLFACVCPPTPSLGQACVIITPARKGPEPQQSKTEMESHISK